MNKKLLLLSLLLFSTALIIKAQSIQLSGYNTLTTQSSTVFFPESHATVENISSSPIDVMIERTIITIPAGQEESFCFGIQCYLTGTTVTTTPTTIQPGATEDFHATINPGGIAGNSSFHYRFYVLNNPADSVGLTLDFEIGTTAGIADAKNDFSFFKPVNNPADLSTLINFKLPAGKSAGKLMVYNMLGSVVKTLVFTGSKGNLLLNTSDIKSGVYFISCISDDKVISGSRLIVRHQ